MTTRSTSPCAIKSNHASTHSVPPVVHDVLRSAGQPLDVQTRAFMEPRFGHDFSRVRVHQDALAAESARAVNALAYTVGSRIVFGAGAPAPHSPPGRWLLAHELSHTMQQNGSPHGVHESHAEHNSQAEREADRQASTVASGGRARIGMRGLEPHLARFSVRGHHIVEEAGLTGAGFSETEREAIHRGNVQRDFSQVGTVGNTLLLCDKSAFGGYSGAQHFDNFIWDATTERWRTRGVGQRFRHENPAEPDTSPIDYVRAELTTLAEQGMDDNSLVHLGNAFHTVEDFFAHSNFIELINNDFALGRDLLTGSVAGTDTSSLLHTVASVSEPRSAEFYSSRARAAERSADPLSHARVAKDQPSHRYHEQARQMAALVVQELGAEVRAVMRKTDASARAIAMEERVLRKISRYLRPPSPEDRWWEALRASGGAAIDQRLEREEGRTPETISQCVFSPLANLEASRLSTMHILPIPLLGVAVPVKVGATHIWIQGGLGVHEGPLPLERSRPEAPDSSVPGGLFVGGQITGRF